MPRSRSHLKLTSPCSPKAVHKVISRFSPEKKQLVRSIGFGGLLELPLHRKVGHRFSLWLLTKVARDATRAQSAAAGKVAGIPFYPHDVSIVFGVPSGGRPVPKKDQVQGLVSDEAKATVRGALGLDEGDDSRLRILHAAKHVLKKRFRRGMAEKDRAAFKVAFVVFVVENLLAPREVDSISLDYFMALRRPDEIQTYDWSEYVIRVILDSACQVQAAFAQGRPVENLFGCILFLQIFYLDNLDFGREKNLLHDHTPRCKAYDYDTIKKLAKADRTRYRDGGLRSFGRKSAREASDVCYERSITRCGNHVNGVVVGSADGGEQDGHSDDIVFTDGRVFNQKILCEVCGDVGMEDLVMFCACGATVHQYCSDPVVLDATLVEWSCDECQAKQGNAAADKLSAEALNRKRPSHYLTEITVATNGVSKKACVQKGDQEEHFA
ncbi:hypothetical protein CFC21_010726 [Triticum aestivum]|uniref:Zinc finger PHD-type domain-containing protein n=2 Tax=Triticum aestivum TaxID=4565 RepID=A0A3B5ZS62_WHEAT|nr:uncharacterized protein LOC123180565 [Triticum aestivum]XP_044448571.1 uncharacterized protein LOC123180565 [Triticum aestivum]XP_044448572.1 uncharacterized protein LOC123180565 [Triticum aestivum]KAF6993910.1 hypothetical protein CFC21_010726 [Triticum aestivum]